RSSEKKAAADSLAGVEFHVANRQDSVTQFEQASHRSGRSICGRITASLRATATVPFRYLRCREPELLRWEGQCMGALGAGLHPTSYTATATRPVGGALMSTRT